MIRRSIRNFILVSVLLAPSIAFAGPITPGTPGTWSDVTAVIGTGYAFWDGGVSNDCDGCGVAAFLTLPGFLPSSTPVEYFHDGTGDPVSFAFDEIVPWTLLFKLSTTPGVFGQRADGAFTYENSTFSSDSLGQGWQYALFRQVEDDRITYFVAVEDIRFDLGTPSDRDYNDFVATFSQDRVAVPEPATLVLMGAGLLGFASRRRRAGSRQ